MRNFIVESMSATDSNAKEVARLSRKQSSSYRSSMEENKEEQSNTPRKSHIQEVLCGPLGFEIIENCQFDKIMSKSLELISQILKKENMVFEDKFIVENALILWLSCMTYKHDLFDQFVSGTIDGSSAE
jgi:hypothetical protein